MSDVVDSFGQEWTYRERKEVERAAQAAYFVAIIVSQMVNGLICKTRYNSLFQVGKAPTQKEIHNSPQAERQCRTSRPHIK